VAELTGERADEGRRAGVPHPVRDFGHRLSLQQDAGARKRRRAGRFVDHLVAMKEGRIVAEGPPATIVDEQLMRDVFGLPSVVMANPVTGTPMVVPTL
jgi:hypothetical protein